MRSGAGVAHPPARKEVVHVFARVSTFQGSPDVIDQSIRHASEVVLPAAQKMSGFKGMLALADRATGKEVAITLWESEAELRASEEAADQLRSNSAGEAAQQIASVERFEIVLDERL
jgi:heme-degrading monooxygenase HmoA